MSNKYDEIYDIVSSMAKTKMLMNSHKGEIENVPPCALMAMIQDELKELDEAIETDSGYLHVIEEVADILNYTIAFAYNAIEKYRGRKDGR